LRNAKELRELAAISHEESIRSGLLRMAEEYEMKPPLSKAASVGGLFR
jgi:hypothetical protein